MSKQTDFISSISSGAREVQAKTGMFASVTIAQSIIETGWGVSHPVDVYDGSDSFNIFGIKARKGEPFVVARTWEVYKTLPAKYISYEILPDRRYKVWIYANFRKFSSIEECMVYRASWLTTSKYWVKAINAETPEKAIHYLQHTGYFTGSQTEIAYATDPDYEAKILDKIKSYNLKQYDLTEEEITMIAELNKKVTTLEKTVEKLGTELVELKKNSSSNSDKVATWAVESREFITTGDSTDPAISDGTYPNKFITRQEVWVMLYRLFNKLLKRSKRP